MRRAFYQALYELAAVAEIVLTGRPENEFRPEILAYTSMQRGTLEFPRIDWAVPTEYVRISLDGEAAHDADLLLGTESNSELHPAIRSAFHQALQCFHRGLFMPAIAMVAAGVEALWTECAKALADRTGDNKLNQTVDDEFSSIGRKVSETVRTAGTENGKAYLKSAGVNFSVLQEVQVWTTVLREKRNALHWEKSKNFVAEHSDAASLIMGLPQHVATLESVRRACLH